ncbi:head GIN domain-containing protein [Mucilaginibacter sp.]|uniref:head GIN domain-containing protein n=1 Tax=Mucilaginibacter sp. TaxID=1882438 RepID=UPI0035BBE5C7
MKKSTLLLSLSALIFIITLSSCRRFGCIRGSGKMVTETRTMTDFTRLDVSGGYKVKLVQDSSMKVIIHADDNLMKRIRTEVEGGKLKIDSRKGLCGSEEITITIGVRNLEEIEASGAVEVIAAQRINVKDLHFDLSGSTKIDMDLSAANVSTEGSGATEVILRGQAASHSIDVSGSSDIKALDFVVGKYSIESSGASECKINVLNSLDIHTSGSSDIKYRGNPSSINKDKSGASSVEKID